MQRFNKLVSLDELLTDDLDALCASLADEFARMGGGRLLITGGGGFLGYYLVQARPALEQARAPPARASRWWCTTTTRAACRTGWKRCAATRTWNW